MLDSNKIWLINAFFLVVCHIHNSLNEKVHVQKFIVFLLLKMKYVRGKLESNFSMNIDWRQKGVDKDSYINFFGNVDSLPFYASLRFSRKISNYLKYLCSNFSTTLSLTVSQNITEAYKMIFWMNFLLI